MDILRIQEFESYTPVFDEKPVFLIDAILEQADRLNPKDKQTLMSTYEYALKYHKGVKRFSGEPYIVHPIKVLEFLMPLKPDLPSMQTALLHDIIEDTEVTYEDVRYHFGEEIAVLCDGLVKVSKVRYRGQDRQLETLKKTFLAMAKDLRVIIIKMADRVHNIQTLHYHPKKDRQQRIALETLKVFVPVAKRLGLYFYQGFLENGAFKMLEPREYMRIRNFVLKSYGDSTSYKEQGVSKLIKLCKQEKVPYQKIKGRLKSPYRIYKKLQKYQTNDISKVMDILAFRVVTNEVTDCYNMLGLIHKHYTPIFSKMKDYIAIPKPNGYKSLHTTVLGMFDFPVEIQVRTEEMDRVANYGVAAHFAYSDEEKPVTVSEKQAAWIKQLQDIVQKYTEAEDKEEFRDELNIEILDKNIFVYTPKGDIIELPLGSTVLDFAFRVHTDIGLKFKNAFINGRIVPIDYKLKTGDIVDIKTFKNKFTAAKGRINFLHTPSAKAKLNRYIRQIDKEKIIEEVETTINEKLDHFELPLLGSKDDQISKTYKGAEYEQLMMKVRDKQISPTKLIRDIYEEQLLAADIAAPGLSNQHNKPPTKSSQPEVVVTKSPVIVDHDKLINYELCQECTPRPGDKIIAKSDRHGIKIHVIGCEAFDTIDYKKLLEAHRKDDQPNIYRMRVRLLTPDRPGVLLQILKIFDFLGINLADIHTEHSEPGSTYVLCDLEFENPSKIAYLLQDLKMRRDLLKIEEKKIF